MRISALFAAVALALGVSFTPVLGPQAQAEPLSTEDALAERVMGDVTAPVEMIEYSSLTCPHCAAFHAEKLPELKKKYVETGKLRIIQRDFPFDRLGAMGAMMARCANPMRYHQFIDVLFKQQDQWAHSQDPVGALVQIGKLGGLSEKDFQACMKNEDLLNGILKMRQDGVAEYDISSTPTFVINGEVIVGNQSLETFEEAIEKHLN
ncbi:DsbA family protein [Hwanghaeella grinnelliae]|uniref:DsbA family protein n=1 Tax=Hwanghaeella grinnelliae TaxID=2500179 RepID=A0A3S2VLI0_9PROT|nr:DsbA family protein [Hwanghaeella grinnelliae]RVU35030.1 DsbA family protein [Hwanghaeella grinnelliae]